MIASAVFNKTGDWLALACAGLGQLLVWEWQSESYILKQQGHFNSMSCLSYSPDGQFIATGGDDGKVCSLLSPNVYVVFVFSCDKQLYGRTEWFVFVDGHGVCFDF